MPIFLFALFYDSIYQYDIPGAEAGEYAERTTDPLGNVTLKTYDRVGTGGKANQLYLLRRKRIKVITTVGLPQGELYLL